MRLASDMPWGYATPSTGTRMRVFNQGCNSSTTSSWAMIQTPQQDHAFSIAGDELLLFAFFITFGRSSRCNTTVIIFHHSGLQLCIQVVLVIDRTSDSGGDRRQSLRLHVCERACTASCGGGADIGWSVIHGRGVAVRDDKHGGLWYVSRDGDGHDCDNLLVHDCRACRLLPGEEQPGITIDGVEQEAEQVKGVGIHLGVR